MDKVDTWTRALDRALDLLFAKYPARTGLGVVLGGVLYFFVILFEPALRTLTFVDFAGAPWWGWLLLGILVMHAPTIASLFRQRPVGDDAIDQALELIERANFTKVERRQQYRNLLDRVINSVALSKDTRLLMMNIEERIIATGSSVATSSPAGTAGGGRQDGEAEGDC